MDKKQFHSVDNHDLAPSTAQTSPTSPTSPTTSTTPTSSTTSTTPTTPTSSTNTTHFKLNDGYFVPTTNIYKTKTHYIIELEIPGANPQSIELNVNGNELTVRGNTPHTSSLPTPTQHQKRRNQHSGIPEHSRPPPKVQKNSLVIIRAARKTGPFKFQCCLPFMPTTSPTPVYLHGLLRINFQMPQRRKRLKNKKIKVIMWERICSLYL